MFTFTLLAIINFGKSSYITRYSGILQFVGFVGIEISQRFRCHIYIGVTIIFVEAKVENYDLHSPVNLQNNFII